MQSYDSELSPQAQQEESQSVMETDEQQMSILFGTYADIMFVLLPFVVVSIFRLWSSDLKAILLGYDLSMAAAILGGLSIVKFILGLLIDPTMLKYKERLVFLIAGTFFLVVVPSLLFAVLIMLANPVPEIAMFVQPMLLVLGIIAYSGSVTSTNQLLQRLRKPTDSATLPRAQS